MSPYESVLIRRLRDALDEVSMEIRSVEHRSIAGKPVKWLVVQLAVEKLSNAVDDCRLAFEGEAP